jgi:hypothetical protein
LSSSPKSTRSLCLSGCSSAGAGLDDRRDVGGERDRGIGVGRVGGLLVSSEDANLALVIRRSKFEPISRRNLPPFLSVVIWSASGESREIAAAKLVFSPFSTPCGCTVHIRLFLLGKEVLFSRKLSSAPTVSDSFVRAILVEFEHVIHFDFERTALSTGGRSLSWVMLVVPSARASS